MAGERWRLGHRPALDGLRGVAILLVIAHHAFVPYATYAGQVGVGAFFVLSGFLISSLLLEESATRGRLQIGAFYVRRARRLAPALILCVTAVAAFATFVGVAVGAGGTPAALLYYMDFVQSSHQTYQPGLFGHTWSLAVEEQFYLIWPLALIGLLRLRVRLVPALSVLAIGLAGWTFVLEAFGAPDARLIYAPDTRACALIAGCALAAAFSRGTLPALPRWAFWTALAGLPAVALAPYYGLSTAGQLVATVPLSLVIVWACVDGGPVPLLSASWLRGLGRRSYGVYLWHFPLLGFVYFAAPNAPWWLWALIALPITAGVVEASWRYVERPLLGQKGGVTPHVLRLRKVAVEA